MKKELLLMITCLMAVTMQAQTEHLKFMGIPLNETINSFQSKLQKKDIKYDNVVNKKLNFGCRGFVGTFSGENSQIFLYYTPKSKIVYRAKAVLECANGEKGEERLTDYKNLLSKKYPDGIGSSGEQDGHPTWSLSIFDENSNIIGFINLYITNPIYSFLDTVGLHIDYIDSQNDSLNDKEKLSDL